VKPPGALHAIAAGLCAALVFVLTACGGGAGGSNSNGGGGGGQQAPPLVITTTSLPQGIATVPYQQTLSATGGTPPYTWSQNGYLPYGLALNPSTGVISGTSPGAVYGPVIFQVADSGSPQKTATQSIYMTFIWQLSFQTTSLPAAHSNVPYDTFIYLMTSADPTTWKLLSGTLPPGLQLTNPSAQQIEITGTTTQTGSYPLTLQVQDNSTPPQVAKQDFVLTVDNALTILTQKLGSAIINSNYSVTLSAINGTTPYQWSAVGLPPSLTIDPASGTISGVPTLYGVFQPTVTVTDSASHTASQILGLTIIAALFVPNYGNLSAVINKPFYDYLTAFGGSPPYSWSLVSGSMPPGLTLDGAHGTITGTPTQLGSYNLTFQVTDTGPPQQSAQWSTTISVVPPQLYIASTLPPKLPLGVPFQWTAAAQGGTPPYHWSAATGTLPPGLGFDPNTADLTGTPTSLGQYTFSLSVSDSGSPQQTATNTLTVNITTPLGRNDAIAHATPLGDGSWQASISPYADPPDSPTPVPDMDYYRIIGPAGSIVSIAISAQASFFNNALDSVLEILDANGVRFNSCEQPGDTSNTFTSDCLNDDIVPGVNHDSQLQIKVPGAANAETTMYAHVFDWRGDARPDMQYYINVSGSIAGLVAFPPTGTTYGSGYTGTSGCVVAQSCWAGFSATGGLQPLIWSVLSGNIPAGMTLDPTFGSFSGTPAAVGTYSFVAQVRDSGSPPQTVAVPFTLTVEIPPVITTASLPDATAGQFYSVNLNATGGVPPYRWGAGANDYNFTLQMNPSTGVLSGVPRVAGSFSVNLNATDAVGILAFSNLPLTVIPGPLTFPSGTYPNAKVGLQYADLTPYLNANGGTPPITITLIGGTVPPGLAFSGGMLTGIPTTAGSYSLLLQASDSSSTPQTLTATYTITINP